MILRSWSQVSVYEEKYRSSKIFSLIAKDKCYSERRNGATYSTFGLGNERKEEKKLIRARKFRKKTKQDNKIYEKRTFAT